MAQPVPDANALLQMNTFVAQGKELLASHQYEAAQQAFEAANAIVESSQGLAGLAEAHFGQAMKRVPRMTPFIAIAQRNHHLDAISHYEKALELEPDNRGFKQRLADIHLARNKKDHFGKAEELFRELLKDEPQKEKQESLQISLARTLEKMGDPDESQVLLERLLEQSGNKSRSLFELSRLFVARGDFEKAEQHYWKALDLITGEEDSSVTMLAETKLLFSGRDLRGYEVAVDKGQYLKRYWRQKDPAPNTPDNERLQEHFSRIHYALENFRPPSEQRDYDDRGNIYIKYGEPDWRHVDQGGIDYLQNESWVYNWGNENLRHGLAFDFVKDAGYGFREVPDLSYALATGYGIGMEGSLLDLYRARADLNYRLYGYVGRVRPPYDLTLASALDRYREEKEEMHRNAPSDVFLMDKKTRFLDLTLDVGRFRGDGGKTRYEIYYSFPIKELDFDKRDDFRYAGIERQIVVRDMDLNVIAEDVRNSDIVIHKSIDQDEHIFIGQVNLEWAPYNKEPLLNLALRNEASRREALHFYNVEELAFTDDSLMISDIQYSFDVRAAQGEPDAFTKHGLRVEPHPSLEMEPRRGVFVYYEIYNLRRDTDNAFNFRVDFTIERDEPRDGAGPEMFDRMGNAVNVVNQRGDDEYLSVSRIESRNSADVYEYTSLDFSGLRPASYSLSVKVTDLATQKVVTRSMPLILAKPED